MDEKTRRILTNAHDMLLANNVGENALIDKLNSIRVGKTPYYSDQSDLAIAISMLIRARDAHVNARNILLDILKADDDA